MVVEIEVPHVQRHIRKPDKFMYWLSHFVILSCDLRARWKMGLSRWNMAACGRLQDANSFKPSRSSMWPSHCRRSYVSRETSLGTSRSKQRSMTCLACEIRGIQQSVGSWKAARKRHRFSTLLLGTRHHWMGQLSGPTESSFKRLSTNKSAAHITVSKKHENATSIVFKRIVKRRISHGLPLWMGHVRKKVGICLFAFYSTVALMVNWYCKCYFILFQFDRLIDAVLSEFQVETKSSEKKPRW